MIKLLACDVDGTLLPNGEAHINNDIKIMLGNLLDKGMNIVIASGRSYCDLACLFGELSERLYFICHDGALAVKQAKALYTKSVLRQNIFDASASYSSKYKCVAFYAENKCYVIGDSSYVSAENSVEIKHCREIKEPIYKLAVYDDANKNILEPAVVPFGLRLCSHSGGCLEYVNAFANKGVALRDIQSRLFLTVFDTAALGNDVNDIKMLREAKYSAVVLPCSADVEAEADVVVHDPCEFLLSLSERL